MVESLFQVKKNAILQRGPKQGDLSLGRKSCSLHSLRIMHGLYKYTGHLLNKQIAAIERKDVCNLHAWGMCLEHR